ncbi:LicD family protein [Neobacillus vireti]|uniref:LicD family protein n=1 Tax=Neobacillus vireti TaxID=220686 RepID=UPI002FFDB31A
MEKNNNHLSPEYRFGFYVNAERKRLWHAELLMYEKFNKICNKYNLNHFLIGGSAIGAVRHKGFIPWDDDLDIGMLRKDFNKFLEVVKSETSFNYEIQYGFLPNNQFSSFLRIRDKSTTGIIKDEVDRNINHGIFIEIYPFDNVCSIKWVRKLQLKVSAKLLNILTDRFYQVTCSKIDRVLISIFKILSANRLWKLWNWNCQLFGKFNTKFVDTVALPVYAFKGIHLYYKKDLIQTQKVDFEYTNAYVAKGNDRCLKIHFGDYMQLPPVDQRGAHHQAIIFYDTQLPYTEYMDKIIVQKFFEGDVSLRDI